MPTPQSPSPMGLNPQTYLIHATTALPVNSGQLNTNGTGTAGDTCILQLIILKNAGPATLTLAGFKGEDGTARNVVLSGSTTADTVYDMDTGVYGGLVNTGAALTLTASVADTVLVTLRPA